MRIDEPHGERWELALDLLASGAAPVELPGVRIMRLTQGPGADGRVLIDVLSSYDPASLTRAAAEREVARARRVIAQAAADPRFADLLTRHQVIWELVWDYSNGSIALARIDKQGQLHWPT